MVYARRPNRQRSNRRVSNPGGWGNFSPTMLPGATLWLRADDGITLNGSTVSAWVDQTPNAHTFSQGTAADQPLWTTANGQASVQHQDATDRLAHASSVSFGTAMTLFYVFARGALASTYEFSDSTSAHGIISNFTGGLVEWFVSAGDRQTLANTPSGLHIACVTQTNGVNLTGYWDGAQQFSVVPGSLLQNLKNLGFGAATNNGNGFKSEMLLYNRVLATEERRLVTGYLGIRYRIPVS